MTELSEVLRSRLESLDRTLDTLETPAVLIDADVADANLARWQERCDRAGIANRPHIKTHRSVAWALRQAGTRRQGHHRADGRRGRESWPTPASPICFRRRTPWARPSSRASRAVAARSSLVRRRRQCRAVVDAIAAAAATAAGHGRSRSFSGMRHRRRAEWARRPPADAAALAAAIDAEPRGLAVRRAPDLSGDRRCGAGSRPSSARRWHCLPRRAGGAGRSTGGSPDMWRTWPLGHRAPRRHQLYNDRSLLSRRIAPRTTRDDGAGHRCVPADAGAGVSTPAPRRSPPTSSGSMATGNILEHPEAVIYQLNESTG